MSYASLLQETGVSEDFLCILRPKFRITTWTVVSGFVYSTPFTLSKHIYQIKVDGTLLTAVSTTTPNAGEYYYDSSAGVIYIRTPQSGNPNSEFTVVLYDLYFATRDEYFHRDPTDSTSTVVFWEGLISRPPQLKETVSQALLGYLPVQSTSIEFLNSNHDFEQHLFDKSYNKSPVSIHHAIREQKIGPQEPQLKTENVKLILQGLTSGASLTTRGMTINLFSRIDEFDKEWRNDTAESFYTTTLFPNLDPNSIGKPIRYIYGLVDGFVPVNVDYVDQNPTTSDNRDWVVMGEQSNLNNVTETVPASPSSTTTRTYVNAAQGFRIGDFVWLNKASDEYREVTAVNYVSNYIEHAAVTLGAAAAGDTVTRYWVSRVEVEQNGVRESCFPGRDYTVASFAGTTSGISFTTSMESNVGLASTLSPTDTVFCRVYGKRNNVTIGGPAFGSDDSQTKNLINPIIILFDILKTKLGLGESNLDLTTFDSLDGTVDGRIGLAIPRTSSETFPTFKTILQQFIDTILFRFYINSDGKWTIKLVAPNVSASDEITDEEISQSGISFDYDYQDIASDFRVKYNFREVGSVAGNTESGESIVTAESNLAKYLHEIENQMEVESLYIESADAQEQADHLSFVHGDRRGKVTINLKDNQFFDNTIGTVSTVSRTSMPGFAFDVDTDRTDNLTLVETTKGLRDISLVFDDNKGVDDNSGSW